jgi:hypothetical protein
MHRVHTSHNKFGPCNILEMEIQHVVNSLDVGHNKMKAMQRLLLDLQA